MIDTEFTDFIDCELMSIGAVSEDGEHEFYVEITDYTHEYRSLFVMDHIVPLLDNAKHGLPYNLACLELSDWIDSLPTKSVEVIVDYGQDHQFMREMLNVKTPQTPVTYQFITPAFINMLNGRGIDDINQERISMRLMHAGMEDYFQIDPRRHHALVDAKANRHGWLKGYNNAVEKA
jgi:hypothetical protein